MGEGLGPGNIVLGGEPTLSKKGAQQPPIFGVTWYGGSLGQATLLDGDPAPAQKRGTAALPSLFSLSIVAKWLDGSGCHLVRR